MEVFISNLDSRTTKAQLQHLLTPHLQKLHIHVFDLRKRNDKTFAQLTLADVVKAQKWLLYATQDPTLLASPSGRFAQFCVSRHPPNHQLVRVLQKEEKDHEARQSRPKISALRPEPSSRSNHSEEKIQIVSLECGRWETTNQSTLFLPYHHLDDAEGSISRTSKALVIRLNTGTNKRHDLVIEFSNIQSMSCSSIAGKSTITISLNKAPKIFEDIRISQSAQELLSAMTLGSTPKTTTTRFREANLPDSSPRVIGSCLTYRLTLPRVVDNLRGIIQRFTFHRFSPLRTQPLAKRSEPYSFGDYTVNLSNDMSRWNASFRWKFQVQALWANGLLSPREIHRMIPAMDALRARSGETALVKALTGLVSQLPFPDARTTVQDGGSKGAIAVMTQRAKFTLEGEPLQRSTRDEVSIHRAVVTPTGIYLYGPEDIPANRVLRKYRAHQDCFLRVLFADEDEQRVELDRDVSNERIFKGRFLEILRKGIDVAGEHFNFLGFSHSSLRTHTCWFMRSFIHEGSLMFANHLVSRLGDFSSIRCPAKCAARIGQAFSETTSAVQIDPKIVVTLPDVKAGQYMFTDGCGTMSRAAWRLLRNEASSKSQPTSYQIRYKGAKGMLTLDNRLPGTQIRLRESMVKFAGSPSNEIEICGTNSRPLPFKLNRQIIKILEDLDVAPSSFEKLQEQAVEKLRSSARSPTSAIDFIRLQLADSSSGLPSLLRCLQKISIDVTEDSFLREILGALLQVQLREIKYRSRILVPSARTLYGISDETGFLKEGEIFVTFAGEESKAHGALQGRVAVTRSPALHPGDIQLANAVQPPPDSSLWKLHNCVVFSQRGTRDLPSKLSGGDLDGDLFNVIYDPSLIPFTVVAPAAYLPVQAVDIGRTVTSEDMTGFFVDFMQNDQLGRIASLHQVFADLNLKGTMSDECLLLAELHSTAVDFSKSGVPVDIKKIPKAARYRPDFMAPSASTKVEDGIKRPTDLSVSEEPEGEQRYRYYESNKVLGILYRAVDEDIFFQGLEDDLSSIFSTDPTDTVLGEILEWTDRYVDPDEYMELLDLAQVVRDHYESEMLGFMSQYTVHRNDMLTEKEVFTGTILGRSGAGSKLQRENSESMKMRFNLELRDTKSWMREHTNDDDDYLNLAAACLAHVVGYKSNVDEKLSSFGWFAAAICVPIILGLQDETELIW